MRAIVERNNAANRVEIDSAGLGSWHVGQLPDARMIAAGKRHGYQIDSRARQVCHEDFASFTHIVAMDNDNFRELSRQKKASAGKAELLRMADFLRHHKGQTTIPDPYYGSEQDFEFVIDLLEDACEGLYEELIM